MRKGGFDTFALDDYFITTYASSDPSIASVNEQGNVYAWKPGTVTITGRFEETEVKEKILCTRTFVQKAERQDFVWFLEQDQGCKD